MDSRRKFIKNITLSGAAMACVTHANANKALMKISMQKASKGCVILFQGDSITDGNRGRNNDPNHIMGHGYAFSIASRVGADFPEQGYCFYNRGISGNKIIDLEQRWQKDTMELKPDILSILIGVNDSASVVTKWDTKVSVQTFESTYNILLEETRAKFPDILFVLGEPFIAKGSRTNDSWEAYQKDMTQRQAIVRKMALKYNAIFVGYQKVFDQAFEKTPVEYWIWDGVHPTVAGHELMTREWLKQVGERIQF